MNKALYSYLVNEHFQCKPNLRLKKKKRRLLQQEEKNTKAISNTILLITMSRFRMDMRVQQAVHLQ